MLFTLNDLKEIAKDSGNDNPSIFLLSDIKDLRKCDEAFPPSNIIVDDNGDIIVLFDEHMVERKHYMNTLLTDKYDGSHPLYERDFYEDKVKEKEGEREFEIFDVITFNDEKVIILYLT